MKAEATASSGKAKAGGAGKGGGGKKGATTTTKKPVASAASSKRSRGKAATQSKVSSRASGKKTATSAGGKGNPKDTLAASKDTSVDKRPTVADTPNATTTLSALSGADLTAAQEQNAKSPDARLRLADVLKEVLEETSLAELLEEDSSSCGSADAVEGGTKTVEETNARLVELYNQVTALANS